MSPDARQASIGIGGSPRAAVDDVGQRSGSEAEQEHGQGRRRLNEGRFERIRGRLVINHPAAAFCIQLPILDSTVASQSTVKTVLQNGLHAEPSASAVLGECPLVFISPSEVELDTDIVTVMPAGAADGASDSKIHGLYGAL